MSRRPLPHRLVDGLIAPLAVAVLTVLGSGAAYAAPSAAAVVAAVTVDDCPIDDPVLLERRGGDLLIAAADLHRLGVPTAAAATVSLAAVPGLAWSFDAATQTLALRTTHPARRTLLSAVRPTGRVPVTPSGWGAIVTYDATLTRAPRATTAAALVDASLFTPAGHAFATVLVGAGGDDRPLHMDRLATGYTLADPDRLRRVTVGDFIPAATAWSRPVRMAGLQFGTDFSLRPDLVTFPVPAITGSAAVPSAVDLVVNGTRTDLGDVRAGRFAVADAPLQTGLNTVNVTMRDALGRETVQSVSLYSSTALLRPGLVDYSIEVGAVRIGYGARHDRYAAAAWSASLRRGLSDRLTVEAHGEGDARTAVLGMGLTRPLGAFGQVQGSLAGSLGGGRSGGQFALGYERIARRVHVSARFVRGTAGFRDLAARYGAVNRSRSLLLNIGFDLGRMGTVGGGVVALGPGRLAAGAISGAGQPGTAMRLAYGPASSLPGSTIATGSWSVRLGHRFSLLATGGADLRRRRAGFATVGLLASFGPRTSVATTATARTGGAAGAVDATRSALLPGEWGWHVGVAQGGIDRLAGGVEYQGAAGHVAVVAEQVNGAGAVRLSARGGLVASVAGVDAVDARTGSVALVETGGEAGVTVYRDNRPAGVTDAHGRLLVANLNPYEATKLSIDPLELADEVAVDAPDVVVRPGERTGVPVRFALRRMSGLLATLVDGNGRPLPAGARARGPDGLDLPVGEGGALFVAEGRPDMLFAVRSPGGITCVAHLRVTRLKGPFTRAGPVRCMEERLVAR